jgi:tetratricopeptide (TPR) repeat protein
MQGSHSMILQHDSRVVARRGWVAAVAACLWVLPAVTLGLAGDAVAAAAQGDSARTGTAAAPEEWLAAPPLPQPPSEIAFRELWRPPVEVWTEAAWVLRELGLEESLSEDGRLAADREVTRLRQAAQLLSEPDPGAGEVLLAALARLGSRTPIRRAAALTLGEFYLRSHRYERAVQVLTEALALFDDPAERWRVHFWVAAGWMALEEPAAAARAFGSAADEAPARTRARAMALRLAGWQHRLAGQDPAAQDAWRAGLKAAAGFPTLQDTLRQDLAEVSFAREDWGAVIQLLQHEEARRSLTARSGFLLGRAFFNSGRPDSARAEFERFLRAFPEAPAAWRDEAHVVLGWDALRRQESSRALAHYEAIGHERRYALPQSDYGSALALLAQQRFEEAATLLAPLPPVASADPLFYPWVYALAYAQFHQGAYHDALAGLEEFRGRSEPDSLSRAAGSLRGDCYYRMGRPEEAYAAYVKASSILADIPELLLRRQALAAMAAERWGATARILGDLIVKYPATSNLSEYHFWRAEAFYRLGRLEMARRHYERAAATGADPIQCAYALGWCDYREGRWEGALTHFDRARQGCRECRFATDLALRRGNSLFNLGRITAAADAFADALQLAEARQETLLVAEASFRRAWTLLRAERFEDAADAFADIRIREGRSPRAAEALYWEGQAHFRRSEYRTAQERLLALLEHSGAGDSLRAKTLLAVGDAYFNQERTGEALEWYRRVLEAPGADRRLRRAAHESLFECRTARGEWDQARSILTEIQEQYPESQGTGERYLALADGFYRDQRFLDALQSYGDFLESAHPEDPRTLRVRYHMASARERVGQRAEAAAAFEALGRVPFRHQSDALLRAGILRLDLGQPEDALLSLEQRLACDLNPRQEAVTRAYLAEAYQRLKETAASRNEWEKVAQAASAAPDSLRAVASLQLGRLAFAERDWAAAYLGFSAAESLGLPGRVYRGAYWAGEAAYRSGDTLRATEWLERFLEAGEEEPLWEATARTRLAECYEGRGQVNAARQQYERILSLPLEERGLQEEARRRLVQIGILPPPAREEGP